MKLMLQINHLQDHCRPFFALRSWSLHGREMWFCQSILDPEKIMDTAEIEFCDNYIGS